MKTKKEIIFEYIQNTTIKVGFDEFRGFTTQELSSEFNMLRPNLSTILNDLVEENRIDKSEGRPVRYKLSSLLGNSQIEESCFKQLIGCNFTLKNSIQLAKAAILYPIKSLPALIIGEKGSGKTYFAKQMYSFAIEKKIIQEDAPFIKFICNDYIDSEDADIIKSLFGNQRESVINLSANGVLLLERINLLKASVRNMFFDLLENDARFNKVTVIICTMDSSISAQLTETIQKKFSIRIPIPKLESYSINERFDLIKKILINESYGVKKDISVNSELLRCVMLYRCEENIKQLKTDFRIACANAYVREMNIKTNLLNLYIHDFLPHVKKGFLFYKNTDKKIEELIPENNIFIFSEQDMHKENNLTIHRDKKQTIYDVIDQKISDLTNRGMSKEDINSIIGVEIESDLRELTRKFESKEISIENISKLVDTKIIEMVDSFLKEASNFFGEVYSQSTYYGLCLHFSSTLESKNQKQRLSNEKIAEITEQYKEKYQFSKRFSKNIENQFNVELPIDEIIFMTMFICEAEIKDAHDTQPVVLIAMHGESTARSMTNVVNLLVKNNNTYAYDLPLDKNMDEAYYELKIKIQEIDQGKGVLFLYDMGSLKTMADMISEETSIEIKPLELPATLIALDSSRKTHSEGNLNRAYDSIAKRYEEHYSIAKETYQRKYKKNLIISLCSSGEGGAIQIKKYLEKNMDLKDIDVIAYATINKVYLVSEISKLAKQHNIICVIGTYNPKLYGLSFISIAQLFDTPVEKLPMLISLKEIDVKKASVDFESISNYLSEELPMLDMKIIKRLLPKVITRLKEKTNEITNEQEIGLFVHIVCAIDKILKGNTKDFKNKDSIILKNKKLGVIRQMRT